MLDLQEFMLLPMAEILEGLPLCLLSCCPHPCLSRAHFFIHSDNAVASSLPRALSVTHLLARLVPCHSLHQSLTHPCLLLAGSPVHPPPPLGAKLTPPFLMPA